MQDWRLAELSDIDRALCDLAERLTRTPHEFKEEDIAKLRELGLSEAAIHDSVQVISYFNYANRIADGLGVPSEDDSRHWEKADIPAPKN